MRRMLAYLLIALPAGYLFNRIGAAAAAHAHWHNARTVWDLVQIEMIGFSCLWVFTPARRIPPPFRHTPRHIPREY